MNIDTEMMDNQGGNLPYEQPSLKKYGTMKEFTHSTGGSSGDNFGTGSSMDQNLVKDQVDTNSNFPNSASDLGGDSQNDTGAD